MIHVFLLFVYMGLGEDKRLKSNDMYFRSVDDCVYYAQRLSKQGKSITAYCLPFILVFSTEGKDHAHPYTHPY